MAEITKRLLPKEGFTTSLASPQSIKANDGNQFTISWFPRIDNPSIVQEDIIEYIEFNDKDIFKYANIKKAVLNMEYICPFSPHEKTNSTIEVFGITEDNITECYYAKQNLTAQSAKGTFSGSNLLQFDLTKLSNDIKRIANGICVRITSVREFNTGSGTSKGIFLHGEKLYLDATYEASAPTPTSPLGGYLDPRVDQTFAWVYDGHKSATLEIYSGGFWKSYVVNNGNGSYTIPANSFSIGDSDIRWRVVCIDSNGLSTEYSEEIRLTSDDPKPLSPTIIRPVNIDVDSSKPITFRWAHNSAVNSIQSAVEIEWTNDAGVVDYINLSTTDQYYDMPVGSITGGTVKWRARTYNTENEVGDWSNMVEFFSITAPQTPVFVSISEKSPRPTVVWAAPVQSAYELVVKHISGKTIYTSGIVTSDVKSHKIKDFLDDDIYSVEVRVFNELNYYSNWAIIQFSLVTIKPAVIDFFSSVDTGGILLTAGGAIAVESYIIIQKREQNVNAKKWKSIAVLKSHENSYIDYFVASGVIYEYRARIVDSLDAFSDSVIVSSAWQARYLHIATADNPIEEIALKWHYGEKQFPATTFDTPHVMHVFAGREFAVAEFDGSSSETIAFQYFIQTDGEVSRDALKEYKRKRTTLLIRDIWGRLSFGVIGSLNQNQNEHGYDNSFSISLVDYDEEVDVE